MQDTKNNITSDIDTNDTHSWLLRDVLPLEENILWIQIM